MEFSINKQQLMQVCLPCVAFHFCRSERQSQIQISKMGAPRVVQPAEISSPCLYQSSGLPEPSSCCHVLLSTGVETTILLKMSVLNYVYKNENPKQIFSKEIDLQHKHKVNNEIYSGLDIEWKTERMRKSWTLLVSPCFRIKQKNQSSSSLPLNSSFHDTQHMEEHKTCLEGVDHPNATWS